ncbi:hypothetical protein FB451DRAFT_760590 [Mycena latifolia]|nr:hypothetical protein FB451DRAFT_760590 [Mycena latifolia]
MATRYHKILFTLIFAAARSPGFHAAIFHDDLMPCQDLLKLYRQSPLLTVYIHAYCDAEFDEAKDYFEKMCQQALDEDDCTFWIRRSTRRLCVDLTPSDIPKPEFYVPEILTPETILPFDDLNIDSWVIDLLQLQEYHSLCYWHLGRTREISVSPQAKWTPGAVIWCPSGSPLEPPVEVASLPYQDLDSRGWSTLDGVVGEITKNGWSRFCSSEIFNTTLDTSASLKYYHSARWLSQANRLFRRLKITSNYEDYVFIRMIVSQLEIPAPTQKAPQGYLLVYPHRDLRTGELTSRWPEYPAFWSFDGVTRLSTEQAAQFGFPSIKFSTQIHGEEWDSSVYAGLRKFHEGKGFDPEDEDLPWHLRGPLYRLSSETDVPFAHDEPEHRPPPMFHSKTTINDLGSLEMEMEVLFAHELSQYHHICYWDLGQCLNISYSEEAELNLAAVVYWPSGSKLEVSDEIALLTDVGAPLFYWVSDQAGRKNLENGWTRYNCRQMSETTIYTARAPKYHDFLSWLSQANYIFSRFRITSNYEAYGASQNT